MSNAAPAYRVPPQENPAGEKKAGDPMKPRHLLSLRETSRDEIRFLLDTAKSLAAGPFEPSSKTVALALFDDDAITRAQIDRACRRLGVGLMALDVAPSDGVPSTARAARALGADTLIIGHSRAGAPWGAARHFDGTVANAGDGPNESPVRGLVDLGILEATIARLDQAHIVFVGAIGLCAPARSLLWGLRQLGASVTLVGPPTLVSDLLAGDGVRVTHDLDPALREADAVYIAPLPPDGPRRCLYPSDSEYARLFGIEPRRLPRPVPVFHPGPVGREATGDLGLPALRERQLRDGVTMWAAVLATLLGGLPHAVAA